jgi:hypothetical protein
MKEICILLVLATICGTMFHAFAEEPETLHTWRFQGKAGPVEIKLSRVVEMTGAKTTTLHIYSPDYSPRSVIEEARFLATVLQDLPKLGVSAESLDWISFRFNESEAVRRLAKHVASSRRWREALKTKKVAVVYPLVTSFLNSSGAYKEWDQVFERRGLVLKVAGVEEVIMEPFSQAGLNCPTGADCNGLVVPKDALIQMNVEPIPHRRFLGTTQE